MIGRSPFSIAPISLRQRGAQMLHKRVAATALTQGMVVEECRTRDDQRDDSGGSMKVLVIDVGGTHVQNPRDRPER
jgi:hypothetical protein